MTFGGLIETLVGLVVVYFLLSVLASGLSESSPAPTTPPVPSGSLQCVVDQMGSVRALGLPLGWNREGPAWPEGTRALVLKVLGLLVTAGALTLAAPFWFDLLNKFVNVRATGQPPAKHGEPSRATQPPPGAGGAGTTRG